MSKRQFIYNQKAKESFQEIVNVLGGEQCKNWSQVCLYLQKNCDKVELKQKYLKDVWVSLFSKKPMMSMDNYALSLKIELNSQLKKVSGFKEYQETMNLTLTKKVYEGMVKVTAFQSLRGISKMISTRKSYNKRLLSGFSFKSIQLLINSVLCEKVGIPDLQEIQECGMLLKDLLICYVEHFTKDDLTIFKAIRQIVSRRQFDMILTRLEQIHILRKIYTNTIKQDDQIPRNPFIKSTIEENQKIPIYADVIQYRKHWQQMYELFMESELRSSKSVLPVSEPQHIVTERKKSRKPQKQYVHKGFTTIVFDQQDDEQSEEEQNARKHINDEVHKSTIQNYYYNFRIVNYKFINNDNQQMRYTTKKYQQTIKISMIFEYQIQNLKFFQYLQLLIYNHSIIFLKKMILYYRQMSNQKDTYMSRKVYQKMNSNYS